VFQDTQIYDDAQSRQGICGKWQGICGNARCKARHYDIHDPFSLKLAWLTKKTHTLRRYETFVLCHKVLLDALDALDAFGAFLLWPEGPERSSAKEMFVQSNVLILGTGRTSVASE